MKYAGFAYHSTSTSSTGFLSVGYMTCCSSLAMLSQSLVLLSFPPWLHPVQLLAEARRFGVVCPRSAELPRAHTRLPGRDRKHALQVYGLQVLQDKQARLGVLQAAILMGTRDTALRLVSRVRPAAAAGCISECKLIELWLCCVQLNNLLLVDVFAGSDSRAAGGIVLACMAKPRRFTLSAFASPYAPPPVHQHVQVKRCRVDALTAVAHGAPDPFLAGLAARHKL